MSRLSQRDIRRLRGIDRLVALLGSETSALVVQFVVVVLHGHLEAKLIVPGQGNER
ncbi:hypothetical protein LX32DRAFT_638429 [Colletotrichum zoysiae]|uniref:Uncharacterized protein n=1 Tax=Colletotrichum zoysiae TaxID=1216348 RepID=A0AAD9HJD9_9PEZI|nr:hypothetical protein LX32DRAFT_638429 [Colletotrichum zoysiae]